MEHIEGKTLTEWEDAHLITEDLRTEIRKLVKKLHTLGIAHQDLHTSNIMVVEDPEGRLKIRIIDYGRAVTRDTLIPLEKKAVELFLEMFKVPDETQARRWSLYKLVAEGVVLAPRAHKMRKPRPSSRPKKGRVDPLGFKTLPAV